MPETSEKRTLIHQISCLLHRFILLSLYIVIQEWSHERRLVTRVEQRPVLHPRQTPRHIISYSADREP